MPESSMQRRPVHSRLEAKLELRKRGQCISDVNLAFLCENPSDIHQRCLVPRADAVLNAHPLRLKVLR
jgi:hypothetical protein